MLAEGVGRRPVLTGGGSCRVCRPCPPWSGAVPASCSPGGVSGWLPGRLRRDLLSGRRRWCRRAGPQCNLHPKVPGPDLSGSLSYWLGLLYTWPGDRNERTTLPHPMGSPPERVFPPLGTVNINRLAHRHIMTMMISTVIMAATTYCSLTMCQVLV